MIRIIRKLHFDHMFNKVLEIFEVAGLAANRTSNGPRLIRCTRQMWTLVHRQFSTGPAIKKDYVELSFGSFNSAEQDKPYEEQKLAVSLL